MQVVRAIGGRAPLHLTSTGKLFLSTGDTRQVRAYALRTGLAGSSFVTDQQVDAFARLEKQTRDFASLTFKADPAAVKVSDEEVKAHYDQAP